MACAPATDGQSVSLYIYMHSRSLRDVPLQRPPLRCECLNVWLGVVRRPSIEIITYTAVNYGTPYLRYKLSNALRIRTYRVE